MTTQYESEQDRLNEDLIVRLLCERWNCEARKLPKRYGFDYALFRSSLVGLLEIKCRKKKYDTLIISLAKYIRMLQWADTLSLPAILCVRWPGEYQYTILERRFLRDHAIEWGGRKDRDDDQDQEPVVHIPVEKYFRDFSIEASDKPA